MLGAFLKHLGLGVLAAVLAGVAGYLLDPAHYAELGTFAGLAALVGNLLGEALKKLAAKLGLI